MASEAMYQQQANNANANQSTGSAQDDNVVDAEFTEKN